MQKLEDGLIYASSIPKNAGSIIVKNSGKIIAGITALIAVLLTFTDITFLGISGKDFTANLFIMTVAAYLMYFSMEDAGEKLGEECDEYTEATKNLSSLVGKVGGEDIAKLRQYCTQYSTDELKYRREGYIVANGYTPDEFARWQSGERFSKRCEKVFARAQKCKSIALTPTVLLSSDGYERRSELKNPTRFKIPKMVMKLIPSTVCMGVTVSVMLTMKDGMSWAGVIEGLLKLGSLPIISFKGYAAGYNHVKNAKLCWINTRIKILEAFIKDKEDPSIAVNGRTEQICLPV